MSHCIVYADALLLKLYDKTLEFYVSGTYLCHDSMEWKS